MASKKNWAQPGERQLINTQYEGADGSRAVIEGKQYSGSRSKKRVVEFVQAVSSVSTRQPALARLRGGPDAPPDTFGREA